MVARRDTGSRAERGGEASFSSQLPGDQAREEEAEREVNGDMASEGCEIDRLRLAKIALQQLKDRPLSWTQLEKRVLRQCGTSGKFSCLMRWMLKQGYIVKAGPPKSRAPYTANPSKVEFSPDGSVRIRL